MGSWQMPCLFFASKCQYSSYSNMPYEKQFIYTQNDIFMWPLSPVLVNELRSDRWIPEGTITCTKMNSQINGWAFQLSHLLVYRTPKNTNELGPLPLTSISGEWKWESELPSLLGYRAVQIRMHWGISHCDAMVTTEIEWESKWITLSAGS